MMESTEESLDGVLVIHVRGSVPEGGADKSAFDERVVSLARAAVAVGTPVVFDLTHCDHFHGGFTPVINLRRNAPEDLGIAMAALHGPVLEKCTSRRIDRMVPVYETVQQAIAAAIGEPVPVHTILGFAFESDLSLAEIKDRLCEVSGTDWKDGDSAWHGDYLGGRLSDEAVARIYDVKSGYVVNLRFYSKARYVVRQFESAKRRLLEEVLPAIGCRNVRPCEPME